MNEILETIFVENGFSKEDNENLNIYTNKSEDFYIIEQYKLDEFRDFFNSEKTEFINNEFFNLSKNNSNYRKNTTLIIYINVKNLKSFYLNYKRQMMRIEEDDYFYRKSIIFYSDNSITQLVKSPGILIEEVSKKENIEKFETDLFFCPEYFVSMLLIIKLPFLQLPNADNNFNTLTELIHPQLYSRNILKVHNKLEKIDIKEVDAFIEEVEKEDSDQQLLDTFHTIFEIDDKEILNNED